MKRVLLVGGADPWSEAIALALAAEGWQIQLDPAEIDATAAPPEALVLQMMEEGQTEGLLALGESFPSIQPWETAWIQHGRAVAQAMVRERRGRIAIVTSTPHLIASVRPLALQLAPAEVTANAVMPGIQASPEEVAHVVRYLCSEEAGFVTAQSFRVGR